MGLRLRFADGPNAGKALAFDDTAELLVIGRDPQKCHLLFPPDETRVGREHCALRRVLGRYRMVLNGSDAVLVDGTPASDGQELGALARLQLGEGGPVVEAETLANTTLPDTMVRSRRRNEAVGEAMAKTLHRSARKERIALGAAFALVAAFGIGAAWMMWGAQSKLADLTSKQVAAVAELNERMAAMKQKVTGLDSPVQGALRKASPSVYLVLIRDEKGHDVPIATAWVAGRAVLGTNAHVAASFHTLSAGQTLMVRSNGTPPRDFAIRRVSIHPGYDEFQKIWMEYRPGRDTLGPSLDQLQQINACDVALMYGDDDAALGAPLVLAPQAKLDSLQGGDTIGYVGYPMEAMALGGVNVRQPTPTTQVGHVTGVTDFFLMRRPGGGGQLVQHALPVAGGASGSPILDAEGEVVGLVSAGNLVSTASGRISTGSGVNFGQRADLLRELLDGSADKAQQERSLAWRADIKQFPSMRGQVVDQLLAQWMTNLPGFQASMIHESKGTIDAPLKEGVFVFQEDVTLPEGGSYLVVSIAEANQAIATYVFEQPGEGATEVRTLGLDETGNWMAAVPVEVDRKTPVKIAVGAAAQGVPFVLYIYRATR